MSAAIATGLDRDELRTALAWLVAEVDFSADLAADVLAAYDAGALELDTLPGPARRKVRAAIGLDPESEEGGDAWGAAIAALVPVARAALPRGSVRWTWDAEAARYVSEKFGVLHPAILRREVDRVIALSNTTLPKPPAGSTKADGGTPVTTPVTDEAARRARALELSRWQVAVEEELTRRHVAMAAAGRGGLDQLTDDDREWIRARLLSEFEHLDAFRAAIEAAELAGKPLSATYIASRLSLYNERTRATFHEMHRRAHEDAGFVEEHSWLSLVDSCTQCPREAAAGWQPIGTLIPVGERECLVRCKCWITYRVRAVEAAA